MEIKLEKEVKFWPSEGKYAVSFVVIEGPEYAKFRSECVFDKSAEKAEKMCLEQLTKRIQSLHEYSIKGDKSTMTIDVELD